MSQYHREWNRGDNAAPLVRDGWFSGEAGVVDGSATGVVGHQTQRSAVTNDTEERGGMFTQSQQSLHQKQQFELQASSAKLQKEEEDDFFSF